MTAANGDVMLKGVDFGTLDDDGKLSRLVLFSRLVLRRSTTVAMRP
jgi:hypothetical protein